MEEAILETLQLAGEVERLRARVAELEVALTQVRTHCEPVNLAGPQEACRIATHVLAKGSVP